jgi:hypothetical protein
MDKAVVTPNVEGKLRLSDGSYIPNVPGATTFKERVERYYAKKTSQFYLGNNEEGDTPIVPAPRVPAQYANLIEDPSRRHARLELELDLKEKEEVLELKQLKLEREQKRIEQNNKPSRAAHVLDMLEQLTDEEIAAVKLLKSGFH